MRIGPKFRDPGISEEDLVEQTRGITGLANPYKGREMLELEEEYSIKPALNWSVNSTQFHNTIWEGGKVGSPLLIYRKKGRR